MECTTLNIIKSTKGILMADATKENAVVVFKDAIGALMKNPIEAWDLVKDMRSLPSVIRDQIFIECLQVFLLNSTEYDLEKQEFVDNTLTSFAVALAEVSPNIEAGYEGDPDRLVEYAKRVVKIIDDCGTIQKSYYLACLARAVRAKYITSTEFFKYSHCIRNLTEEDLQFLGENITQNVITTDEEYIDDYKALGLMKDVDGGFAYTKRAFKLVKYAIIYEENVVLPETFPERFMPITVTDIDGGDIDALFEDKKKEIIEEAAEKASPKWEVK